MRDLDLQWAMIVDVPWQLVPGPRRGLDLINWLGWGFSSNLSIRKSFRSKRSDD